MTWQPIETAPRDGTAILASGLDHGKGPGRHYSVVEWMDFGFESGWYPDEDTAPLIYLSHWMPLPAPPTDDPIDWDKPVRTLEGNPARVICTDYRGANGRCEHPILAVVTYPEGVEVIGAYTRAGEHHLCYTGEMDLINRAEEEADWLPAPPTDTPRS